MKSKQNKSGRKYEITMRQTHCLYSWMRFRNVNNGFAGIVFYLFRPGIKMFSYWILVPGSGFDSSRSGGGGEGSGGQIFFNFMGFFKLTHSPDFCSYFLQDNDKTKPDS